MFMTMRTHINNVLSSCYGSLRQIRTIKRSLQVHALNTLVTSLVCSRLDYCNVVFGGLSACDLQRLQSILYAAVRLVTNASRRDCITPLLCDCHWLPIKQRIDYKLCMMVKSAVSQRWSQICCIQYSRCVVARIRPVIRCSWSQSHHRCVALLSIANSRHVYTMTILTNTVRCPVCQHLCHLNLDVL